MPANSRWDLIRRLRVNEDDCTLVKKLPIFGGALCLHVQGRTHHSLHGRALHLTEQHHEPLPSLSMPCTLCVNTEII